MVQTLSNLRKNTGKSIPQVLKYGSFVKKYNFMRDEFIHDTKTEGPPGTDYTFLPDLGLPPERLPMSFV